MVKTKWVDDTLTLGGQEVPVKNGSLPQTDLRFYTDNPRIYSIVRSDESDPSQSEIQKRLVDMDHVKQLVQSIRANGGLTDPLIVRDSDYVVLEGNSRLAAYRLLARNDAIRWGKVKVKLLPADIGEDLIFALLGEYHIIGRKDWAPYEQAGYLYRREIKHGVDPALMAKEMGLSRSLVKRLIEVYSFMVQHEDNDVSRWSYYDEYLKPRATKRARLERPELDKVVVKKIKAGEIPRAVDVRDKLSTIIKTGGKTLNTFVSKDVTFERCYLGAVTRGVDNPWLKRLKAFRTHIADEATPGDLRGMREEHRKRCLFELKKIHQRIGRLISKLELGG